MSTCNMRANPIHEDKHRDHRLVDGKKRDHRRAVRFHPKARVLEIPTVEEMSDSEIASL